MHQPDLCRLLDKYEANGTVDKGDRRTYGDERVHSKGPLGKLLDSPGEVIPGGIDIYDRSDGKGENIGKLRGDPKTLVGHHQSHSEERKHSSDDQLTEQKAEGALLRDHQLPVLQLRILIDQHVVADGPNSIPKLDR